MTFPALYSLFPISIPFFTRYVIIRDANKRVYFASIWSFFFWHAVRWTTDRFRAKKDIDVCGNALKDGNLNNQKEATRCVQYSWVLVSKQHFINRSQILLQIMTLCILHSRQTVDVVSYINWFWIKGFNLSFNEFCNFTYTDCVTYK